MTLPPVRVAAAVLALAVVGSAHGASRRPWYAPDQAKLQFAGNVGFLSPGVGYAWAGERLEGDLFFGWVPESVGGDDIVSFTGKLTWLPWRLSIDRRWLVRPLSVALQLTYTLGDEYFIVSPPRYGADYYDFPTALHAGLAFGGTVGRKGSGTVRELGAYWEVVALDTMLVLWAQNRRGLDLDDVFSLAVGVRAAF